MFKWCPGVRKPTMGDNESIRVLFYDREESGKRHGKNRKAIEKALDGLSGYVTLVCCDRATQFAGEPGAMERLLSNEEWYDAVIVNAGSPDSEDAIDAGLLHMSERGLSGRRVLRLHGGKLPGDVEERNGFYIPASGGNGHLLEQDAKGVALALRNIAEGKEPVYRH